MRIEIHLYCLLTIFIQVPCLFLTNSRNLYCILTIDINYFNLGFGAIVGQKLTGPRGFTPSREVLGLAGRA